MKSHVLPRFGGGRQQLTLVYVEDLAVVVGVALTHPEARREVFFVGADELVTARELAQRVATDSGGWTSPLPLPTSALWLACQWAEMVTRFIGKANVLSAQKYAELKAPGLVYGSPSVHGGRLYVATSNLEGKHTGGETAVVCVGEGK